MNIFQKGGGGNVPNGTNADPVTCAQLTRLFDQLITAIQDFPHEVPPPGPTPGPPPPVDLTAIVAALTVAPGPLVAPTLTVPTVPARPTYGAADFANDLEAAKEQLLGETQVFGA